MANDCSFVLVYRFFTFNDQTIVAAEGKGEREKQSVRNRMIKFFKIAKRIYHSGAQLVEKI